MDPLWIPLELEHKLGGSTGDPHSVTPALERNGRKGARMRREREREREKGSSDAVLQKEAGAHQTGKRSFIRPYLLSPLFV